VGDRPGSKRLQTLLGREMRDSLPGAVFGRVAFLTSRLRLQEPRGKSHEATLADHDAIAGLTSESSAALFTVEHRQNSLVQLRARELRHLLPRSGPSRRRTPGRRRQPSRARFPRVLEAPEPDDAAGSADAGRARRSNFPTRPSRDGARRRSPRHSSLLTEFSQRRSAVLTRRPPLAIPVLEVASP
jgi:hypothetical protein